MLVYNSTYSVNNAAPQSLNNTPETTKANFSDLENQAVQRIQAEKTAQEKNQNTQNSEQQKTRFDVDEVTLANIINEQGGESASLNSGKAPLSSFDKTPSSDVKYDQPSGGNLTAVNTYQSVDNIAKRESVKEAFGVNLYA